MASQDDKLDFEGYRGSDVDAFFWPESRDALTRDLKLFLRFRIAAANIQKKKKGIVDPVLSRELTAGLLGLKVVHMTKDLDKATQISKGLDLILQTPATPEHEEIARYLKEKWAAEEEERRLAGGEVEPEIEEEEEEDIEEHAAHVPRSRKPSAPKLIRDRGAVIPKPNPRHEIYGRDGIMHGLLVDKSGGRRVYIADPSYSPRPSKVYGNNGFKVGDWFPLQRIANLRGAHGPPMAGIAIGPEGAYSIVVKSGSLYDEYDKDLGNILYYSGSGSHENVGNVPKETSGTLSLRLSMSTQRPVRVLRAGGSSGVHPKPVCGMRYDGLYRVNGSTYKKNRLGGSYEQFKLERIEGQAPIDHTRPTSAERNAYEKIQDDY